MEPTLSELAYHRIREMLGSGKLRPGARLVNRTLAKDIGMSFTPVREAINQLASEGFVEYVRGSGAFVREPGRVELEHLYDLRACLEPFAAAQAAVRATHEQIELLHRLCLEWLTLARLLRTRDADEELFSRWLDLEERFHEEVLRASGNTWLIKIATDLRLLSVTFATTRQRPQILNLSMAAKTWRTHRELVRHLEKGDSEGARRWMLFHIRSGKSHVVAGDGSLEVSSAELEQA